jgi:hypothetical protein
MLHFPGRLVLWPAPLAPGVTAPELMSRFRQANDRLIIRSVCRAFPSLSSVRRGEAGLRRFADDDHRNVAAMVIVLPNGTVNRTSRLATWRCGTGISAIS